MVDKEKIFAALKANFVTLTMEQVTINDQGLVSVKGMAEAINIFSRLPVSFLEVSRGFHLGKQPTLTSLVGSPQYVGGDFLVKAEILESLEGAPHTVRGTFGVRSPELKSLEHLPQGASFYFLMWNPHLPMLRLLTYKNIQFGYPVKYGGTFAGEKAWKIMQPYMGTNNPGDILRCASELNEAGFEGNAEW
jgi:hypothetical protein